MTIPRPDGTTGYVYDADGNVLLQTDPTSTTLYLPGEQLTLTGTTTTGVRYLPLPGGGTAVRTGTGTNYKFQISDPHGTSGLYLDNTAQTPTWRQFTPYGAPRGTTVSWIDNRGFLNAPDNANTGLTQLGARQYDPTLGRFTSLDPLFEATDDQQLAGYAYAAGNPITNSDPSGLCPDADCPTRNCPSCLNSTPGNKASTDAAIRDTIGSGNTPSNKSGTSDASSVGGRAAAKAPQVENGRLRGILADIYIKPGSVPAVGDGKVGTALISELQTGEPTKNLWHVADAADQLTRLVKLLEDDRKPDKNVNLSEADRAVALAEADELWKALNTVDDAGAVTKLITDNSEVYNSVKSAGERMWRAP
ncbi:RHS repeat-associated protein [Streptomyces sp. 3330]|uniref:RHS repeat-associated core domain-containing protein n=1 Tax=Streptomyces sp. 3330 TaxID=2817755 RepID=UPI00286003CF|nr:RHS repeat-associated core domain-containing protein [Streptomyces sp. 3330]MDR6981264.1 RHS repeat-associated protein [Streptomyces sp. 3330]